VKQLNCQDFKQDLLSEESLSPEDYIRLINRFQRRYYTRSVDLFFKLYHETAVAANLCKSSFIWAGDYSLTLDLIFVVFNTVCRCYMPNYLINSSLF